MTNPFHKNKIRPYPKMGITTTYPYQIERQKDKPVRDPNAIGGVNNPWIVKDITDADIVADRYKRLDAEQSARKLMKEAI